MTDPSSNVPLPVVVRFAHAAAQTAAEARGLDLLHLKGPAVPEHLRPGGNHFSDADVLVRPDQAEAMVQELRGRGWTIETGFRSGSPFEHACTLMHPTWGYLDVHRLWPGFTIPPADAFAKLWANRIQRPLATVWCATPGELDQRLILCLNAARAGGSAHPDALHLWHNASDAQRGELRTRSDAFGAQVALAVVTGDLANYRHRPEYHLWQAISTNAGRTQEWIARARSAPTKREGVYVLARALLVNREHLTVLLGHPPTRAEMTREFVMRIRRAVSRREGS